MRIAGSFKSPDIWSYRQAPPHWARLDGGDKTGGHLRLGEQQLLQYWLSVPSSHQIISHENVVGHHERPSVQNSLRQQPAQVARPLLPHERQQRAGGRGDHVGDRQSGGGRVPPGQSFHSDQGQPLLTREEPGTTEDCLCQELGKQYDWMKSFADCHEGRKSAGMLWKHFQSFICAKQSLELTEFVCCWFFLEKEHFHLNFGFQPAQLPNVDCPRGARAFAKPNQIH